jgi:hypothetical protein
VFHLHERCGELQDGNALGPFTEFESPRDIEAVDVGQVHVEQNEIRLRVCGKLERGRAVSRFDHIEAMLSQRAAERISQRRVVVDNEDERCTQWGSGSRLLRGMVNCSRIAALQPGYAAIRTAELSAVSEPTC